MKVVRGGSWAIRYGGCGRAARVSVVQDNSELVALVGGFGAVTAQ